MVNRPSYPGSSLADQPDAAVRVGVSKGNKHRASVCVVHLPLCGRDADARVGVVGFDDLAGLRDVRVPDRRSQTDARVRVFLERAGGETIRGPVVDEVDQIPKGLVLGLANPRAAKRDRGRTIVEAKDLQNGPEPQLASLRRTGIRRETIEERGFGSQAH